MHPMLLPKPNVNDSISISEWLVSIADEYNYQYLALLANIDTTSMKLLVDMLARGDLEIGELAGLGSGSYTECKDFVNSIIIRNRMFFNASNMNNNYEYWMRFIEQHEIMKNIYRYEMDSYREKLKIVSLAIDSSRITSREDAEALFAIALSSTESSYGETYYELKSESGLFGNNSNIELLTTPNIDYFISYGSKMSKLTTNSPSFIKYISDSVYDNKYCKNHIYAIIGDISGNDSNVVDYILEKIDIIINREFKFFTGVTRGVLLLKLYSEILKALGYQSDIIETIDKTFEFRNKYRLFLNKLITECDKHLPLIPIYSI